MIHIRLTLKQMIDPLRVAGSSQPTDGFEREGQRIRFGRLIMLSIACLISWHLIPGQELTPLPGHSQQGFAGAENRWQLQGSDSTSQADWLAPDLRAKRDTYWLSELQEHVIPNSTSVATEPLLANVEFPYIEDGAYLVVTFSDYRVIAVDSAQSQLYTERHLKVEDVIYQPPASHIQIGGFIDSDIPGGSRRTRTGEHYSFLISPKRFALQPGHQYIVLVRPNSSSSFYDVVKFWLIQDGKVVPENEQELIRADAHSSRIADVPLSQAKIEAQKAILEERARLKSLKK